MALINLPVVIPHTAAGIALLLVFGRRGLLGQWFSPLGITFTDNLAGIVVAMLFVSLPFLVNLSREAFAMVDEEFEKIALIDGASQWQAFFSVTLPLAWRGVLGGAVMMWAWGISDFGAVVILAYHPKIVPVLIYERFEGFGLQAAQPIALLLISRCPGSIYFPAPGTTSQTRLIQAVMSLIQILLQPIFHLLYHQFAWTYDFVAAFVSLGRWQDWVDAVVPFMSGRVLEIGFGPGHLQELLNRQIFRCSGWMNQLKWHRRQINY